MSRTLRSIPSWFRKTAPDQATRRDEMIARMCDRKPMDAKAWPSTAHPSGMNARLDDHGHYGAGGARALKKLTSAARRTYGKGLLRNEVRAFSTDPIQ